MSKSKRRIVLFLTLLFLLPIMLSSSIADHQFSQAGIWDISETEVLSEIKGLPVYQETPERLADFLQRIEWQSMPVNTPQYGVIKGFACNQQQNKCVVDLNNIYFYEENICRAVYSFSVAGSYDVFSDSDNFFVLFHRGDAVLQFDENNHTVLYKIDTERCTNTEWANIMKIGLRGDSISLAIGDYSICNQHPRIMPVITATYDTLIWKGTVVYETSLRAVTLIVFCCFHILAIIILISLMIKRKRRSRAC